ncbi:hypothetical protein KA005_44910 [bacterium]|nr:hypothetical protein [bacterium]
MPISEDGGAIKRIGTNGSIIIDTVNKWGEQVDVDIADAALGQVLWPIKAGVQAYPFLFAVIAMTIQSTSVLDINGSSGADTIKLTYQTLAEEVELIIPITGTTPVALPNNLGIFRLEVETSGAGNTNAGIITVENGGTVYAQINAGEGQSKIAVQRVPGNRVGTVKSHRVSYAKILGNNDATVNLKVKKADGTEVIKWPAELVSTKVEDIKTYGVGGIHLEPGEFVYWECNSVGANDTPLRGSFDIELEVL